MIKLKATKSFFAYLYKKISHTKIVDVYNFL